MTTSDHWKSAPAGIEQIKDTELYSLVFINRAVYFDLAMSLSTEYFLNTMRFISLCG